MGSAAAPTRQAARASMPAWLLEAPATRRDRCRCGTAIAAGERCFTVHASPGSPDLMLEDRTFCSLGCIRAHLLESLELVESSPAERYLLEANSIASVMRQYYAELPAAP